MTFRRVIVALACLVSGGVGMAFLVSSAQIAPVAQIAQGAQEAPEPKVTPVLSKDLTDLPGKEGLLLKVEYPPGGADPVHRHYADAFVYVLEGSVVMQLRGGQETVL